MKLKSLLFGSAAVLAAGTGAQAADLPTAEPVEYVRICDAFGTGFYYIPGTDTCLRVGGRVRAESHYENGDDFVTPIGLAGGTSPGTDNLEVLLPGVIAPLEVVAQGAYTDEEREFNNWSSEAQGQIYLDARTQTDFGLIRTYIVALASIGNGNGFDTTGGSYGGGFALDEAFIQIANDWGTYTAGNTYSRFNYIGSGMINKDGIGLDANDPNVNMFAWSFGGGNGFSLNVAIEDPNSRGGRKNNTLTFATFEDGAFANALFPTPPFALGSVGPVPFIGPTDNYEGQEAPDLVANIRVDQGWGSLQVMGALRHLNDVENFENGGTITSPGGLTDTTFFDEPVPGTDESEDADAFGFAVGAGLTLNLPFFGLQFNGQGGYAEGAIDYVTTDPIQNNYFGGISTGDFIGPDAEDGQSEAWNFHGYLSGDITQTVGFVIGGSYTEVDAGQTSFGAEPGFVAGDPTTAALGPVTIEGVDYSHWGTSGQLNWQPVDGLSFQWEAGYAELELDVNAAQAFSLSNFTTTEDNFEMYRTSFRVQRAF